MRGEHMVQRNSWEWLNTFSDPSKKQLRMVISHLNTWKLASSSAIFEKVRRAQWNCYDGSRCNRSLAIHVYIYRIAQLQLSFNTELQWSCNTESCTSQIHTLVTISFRCQSPSLSLSLPHQISESQLTNIFISVEEDPNILIAIQYIHHRCGWRPRDIFALASISYDRGCFWGNTRIVCQIKFWNKF